MLEAKFKDATFKIFPGWDKIETGEPWYCQGHNWAVWFSITFPIKLFVLANYVVCGK